MNNQAEKIRLPASEGDCWIGQYVVAYIDLMGQREILGELKGCPVTPENEDRFRKLALDCVRKIYNFRQSFNGFFEQFTTQFAIDLPRKINEDQKLLLEIYRDCDIRFQGFSDTLIVYLPLKNTHSIWQSRAIDGLMLSLGLLLPFMLENGVAFRAGVDLGLGAELVPGEIYGPVLQDAYDLENQVAKYPSIVVGKGLIEFIDLMPSLPERPPFNGVLQTISERLKAMLRQRGEDVVEIDYAGIEFRNLKINHWAKHIQKAYEKICGDA